MHGLNEAPLEAIRRARFKPATKGGKPVSTELTYGYTFAIN
jgi:protein TonB